MRDSDPYIVAAGVLIALAVIGLTVFLVVQLSVTSPRSPLRCSPRSPPSWRPSLPSSRRSGAGSRARTRLPAGFLAARVPGNWRELGRARPESAVHPGRPVLTHGVPGQHAALITSGLVKVTLPSAGPGASTRRQGRDLAVDPRARRTRRRGNRDPREISPAGAGHSAGRPRGDGAYRWRCPRVPRRAVCVASSPSTRPLCGQSLRDYANGWPMPRPGSRARPAITPMPARQAPVRSGTPRRA